MSPQQHRKHIMRQYVGHKPIKRFQITGRYFDEADAERVRRRYIDILRFRMNEAGYAVHDDIDFAFSTQYNEDGSFDFLLTMHGVYLGRAKAKICEAVYGGMAVFKTSIPKVK